jgi:hypothetical protein
MFRESLPKAKARFLEQLGCQVRVRVSRVRVRVR